ncbi:MAG TPA: DNA polymerase III subunit gamma/tau C-terminal domain-containing protein, partial [Gammaproteobacteria bacterium]
MLAFRPESSRGAVAPPASTSAPAPQRQPEQAAPAATATAHEAHEAHEAQAAGVQQATPAPPPAPPQADAVAEAAPAAAEPEDTSGPLASPTPLDGAGAWAELVAKLPLTGMTRQLAEHTALLSHADNQVELAMDPGFENLYNPKWEQGLAQALEMYYGRAIKLTIHSGEAQLGGATPQQMRQEQQAARQQQAEQSINEDPALQSILDHFDGQVEPGSVRPSE